MTVPGSSLPDERNEVVAALAGAGSIAPAGEADELLAAAARGKGTVGDLLARRIAGEPLAWVVGSTSFGGLRLRVDPGVFVPRPQTEELAARAAASVPDGGAAIDLCTGCGAVAAVVAAAHPRAMVVATDADPVAVACARANGVDARLGDLDDPLPPALLGRADVLTAVVPYVPEEQLHLLPGDVLAHEPRGALDGGPRGTTHLLRAVERAPRWLRPGGVLLLELGGDQASEVGPALERAGFVGVIVHRDAEGDVRSIEARRAGSMS
jgi:release factor glutamine methyltransferase